MKKLSFLPLVIITFLFSCTKKEDHTGGDPTDQNVTVYESISSKQILPAYANLQLSLSDLSISINTLRETVSSSNLKNAQEAFNATYIAYQKTTPFEFGPAEEANYLKGFNLFPLADQAVYVDELAANGAPFPSRSGDYIRSFGFIALEYMLFTKNLDYLEGNDNAFDYIEENITRINAKVTTIYNEWKTDGGNYAAKFNSNTGTSADNTLSLLINNVNKSYEFIKKEKFAFPSGYISSLGNTYPDHVEGYFTQNSIELALSNLDAVRNLFTGVEGGQGLNTLLEDAGEAEVATKLITELDEAIALVKGLNDPLSEEIINNNAAVLEASGQLQEVVQYMKNDVPEALDVAIEYDDGDGD